VPFRADANDIEGAQENDRRPRVFLHDLVSEWQKMTLAALPKRIVDLFEKRDNKREWKE
jgi:hypothetical protein